MAPRRTPRERLLDIEDAIDKIQQFVTAKNFAEFTTNSMLHDAVVRNLEVISEASRFLPQEIRSLEPEIPWRSIADIGNWLRHGYDVVSDDILWATITESRPPLKSAVARILGSCG